MNQLNLFSAMATVLIDNKNSVVETETATVTGAFYSLQSLKELARRAHYHTSFDPDKRAVNLIREHEQELSADRETIISAAPNVEAATEALERYTEGYLKYFKAWLSAKSNCISSMITGPANFPVRRAEKANRTESNRYQDFANFRQKALKGAVKSFSAPVTPLSELEQARMNLMEREKTQAFMKEVNSIIRSKKNVETKLSDKGLSQDKITKLLTPSFGGTGYASFELTNNNAQIKRLRERVIELEAKQQASQKEDATAPIPFDGGEIILNYEADRLQLLFNDKPAEEMRSSLKKNGFKWAPSSGAWQRKLTPNAIATTKQLLKVSI